MGAKLIEGVEVVKSKIERAKETTNTQISSGDFLGLDDPCALATPVTMSTPCSRGHANRDVTD